MTTLIDPLVGNEDAGATLARFVAELRYDDIDEANREATKRLTLDCLGAGIAAVAEAGVNELRELATDWGGKPEATLFKSGVRVPAHNAVAANSTACRALEIDDVHEVAVIHTSATIVPVAFAMAERSETAVSGRELIAAIAAATDLANRLSIASRVDAGDDSAPRMWSSTNLTGCLAAAVTAAKLAGADAETMLHALGYGYSNATATKQGLVDQALSVRVQHGLCAANGLMGAELALRGLTGPVRALEGRFGYYQTFWGGLYDRHALLDGLGETLSVVDVSIKPYPCCKFTHTAVAAAIEAGRDPRFDPAAVTAIRVSVENEEYYNTVCHPPEVKRNPSTSVEGQFSLPYCAAIGLLRGDVTFADIETPLAEEAKRLARLTECSISPAPTRTFPSPAEVVVELADGVTITTRAACAPGHPDAPFDWDDVVTKFRACCAFPPVPPPAAQMDELAETIAALEEVEDVRTLVPRLLAW